MSRQLSAILVWMGVPINTRTVRTIKTIQRGVLTSTASSSTATLSPAVTTAVTTLSKIGQSSTFDNVTNLTRIEFTSSTQLTVAKTDNSNSASTSYQVVETYGS